MKLSPSRQRNAVSEGMALGIVMCGRSELPWDKVGIDLAFEAAWRNWSYSVRFSQVSTDLRNGSDGVWVITHADERKQVWNLFWDTSGSEIVIYLRDTWADVDFDPVEVARSIDGEVPAEGWKELAVQFLTRLG
jgi:hypothetical protein